MDPGQLIYLIKFCYFVFKTILPISFFQHFLALVLKLWLVFWNFYQSLNPGSKNVQKNLIPISWKSDGENPISNLDDLI